MKPQLARATLPETLPPLTPDAGQHARKVREIAPEFAGNKPSGIVSTCQDCHMRDVLGKGCNDPAAPTRPPPADGHIAARNKTACSRHPAS